MYQAITRKRSVACKPKNELRWQLKQRLEQVSAREQSVNAYVTNVTHGKDTENPSNPQVLKHNNVTELLSQLKGIESELLEPNLESMKRGIKELEVVRFGSDKGSLEEINAESKSGDPGIN
nr:hypothetical protein CFP56_01895 [Quercus suber]